MRQSAMPRWTARNDESKWSWGLLPTAWSGPAEEVPPKGLQFPDKKVTEATTSSDAPAAYQFGAFRLDARQHQLLRDGVVVALTPKAFETLLLLVRRHGNVIS